LRRILRERSVFTSISVVDDAVSATILKS